MKILKLILIIAGMALIAFGLWNAFIPKEALDIGLVTDGEKAGPGNQISGMIGLGVVALVAGVFLKNRR